MSTSETTSIPTTRPVGYAFVGLSTAHEVQKAITELAGKFKLDRKIPVQLARKPETAAKKQAAATSGAPQQRSMGDLGGEGGSQVPFTSGPYDVSVSAFDSQDHQLPLVGSGILVAHREGQSSHHLASVLPKQESFHPTSGLVRYPNSSSYLTPLC